MQYQKISRTGGLLSAALVATVTVAVTAHAVQTLTAPNAFTSAYSLSSGGNGSNITPPANIPVFVMGDQTTTGDVGSSDMTVVNSAGRDQELVWSGLESDGGGVTAGFSPAANTHIMFIDFAHCVDLQVTNATSFHVHNGCSFAATGNVTEIW
jgi:hypothetical protein